MVTALIPGNTTQSKRVRSNAGSPTCRRACAAEVTQAEAQAKIKTLKISGEKAAASCSPRYHVDRGGRPRRRLEGGNARPGLVSCHHMQGP